jgi:Putative transposase
MNRGRAKRGVRSSPYQRYLLIPTWPCLPHIHCVVPAGGLALDRSHWVSARSDFFLPIPVLRKVFRGKFVAGLKRLRQRDQLWPQRTSGPVR